MEGTATRVDYSTLTPREITEAIRELERNYIPEHVVQEHLEPAWAVLFNRLGYDVPAGDEPQLVERQPAQAGEEPPEPQ